MSEKMKPEIKEKWLAALRSGEYQQCAGALRRSDHHGNLTHCCLGVLCDLAAKDGIGKWEAEHFISGGYRDIGLLTGEVVEWAGTQDYNPDVVVDDAKGSNLAMLNDNGRTFAEIADVIEAQL